MLIGSISSLARSKRINTVVESLPPFSSNNKTKRNRQQIFHKPQYKNKSVDVQFSILLYKIECV